MSHPYSGAASYIYANEYLSEDNLPIPKSSHSRQNKWIPVVSPIPLPVQPHPHVSGRRFMSVPHLPPTSFKSDRYKAFSASSSVATAPQSSIPPSYTYESMRVRFDTPNQRIVAWRRQVQTMKRRINRFRVRLSQLLMPKWITTPHPRLSMIE
jgi:hypothetical protein